MRVVLVSLSIIVVVVIGAICSHSTSEDDKCTERQFFTNLNQDKITEMLNSESRSVDLTTWRLFAIWLSKTGQWESVQSVLNRIRGIVEHPPTLAVLYMECNRQLSATSLLNRLQEALDEDAAVFILHYAFQNGDFDSLKLILRDFSSSMEVRLRAGQLLQLAVADRDLDAIKSLKAFCLYFDREAAIQAAVYLSDLELIMALDIADVERRWRYQLGLAALLAAYDTRNERLSWHIFHHFNLSIELYDASRFANVIYRKWYYTGNDYGKSWYEKVSRSAPPKITTEASVDVRSCRSSLRLFTEGILGGDMSAVEMALLDIRQSSDLYANTLVAGCVLASNSNQEEISGRLLQLTDERTRAAVVLVAGHIRNLSIVKSVVGLAPIPGSRSIQSEIGRLMEYAVINNDKEMFSVLMQFKDRDTASMFGMIRAAVYAIRHGDRYWTDAVFQELSILELRHCNRLLLHIIGAALETDRHQLAFDYWRLRVELNERSAEIRHNARRNREYANDEDRVGSSASESYLRLGYALMMTSIPALEPLPKLLQMVSERGYDFDLQQCEAKLMHLQDTSKPFWTKPERDPVREDLFLPDYCKQMRPDLYPEFVGKPALPVPNGWRLLGKAVLIDLKNWGRNAPLLRRTRNGIPDRFRPINT